MIKDINLIVKCINPLCTFSHITPYCPNLISIINNHESDYSNHKCTIAVKVDTDNG